MTRARAILPGLLAVALAACAGGSAPGAGQTDWSRHDLGRDGPKIHAMADGGPGFIGVGGDVSVASGKAEIWSSEDGLTWTAVEAPAGDGALVDIVAGGPGFVAITASPASAWTSPDGIRWTEAARDTFGTATLRALAGDSARLVAVGPGGFWVSPDGATWRSVAVPGLVGSVNDVVAGGPGFVAVGNVPISSMETKGAVWTSPDGTAWTRIEDDPVFERSDIWSLAVDGETLVGVGFTLEPSGQIRPLTWRSRDGLAWDRGTVADESIPVPSGGNLEGAALTTVAKTSTGWLAAGVAVDIRPDGGALDVALWHSADGSTWTRHPHRPAFEAGMSGALQFAPSRIVVDGERVLVVGSTQGPQTTIWVSPPAPGGAEPSPRPSAPPSSPRPDDGTLATPAPMAS
jgi:hypothetical protein